MGAAGERQRDLQLSNQSNFCCSVVQLRLRDNEYPVAGAEEATVTPGRFLSPPLLRSAELLSAMRARTVLDSGPQRPQETERHIHIRTATGDPRPLGRENQ